MEIPPDALGFAVVVATLLGTAFGVKLLVWGKGPIRRLRGGSDADRSDERLAELEERVRQLFGLVSDQSQLLEDIHERLDFTERVLAQHRDKASKMLDAPASEPS